MVKNNMTATEIQTNFMLNALYESLLSVFQSQLYINYTSSIWDLHLNYLIDIYYHGNSSRAFAIFVVPDDHIADV